MDLSARKRTPEEVLQAVFGYSAFRGRQAEIIDWVVDGGDALVLMPTGGGKSLCYQIPALVRSGTALVISPLIALMQDQVEALRQSGVAAAYLNSTLHWGQVQNIENALREGLIDLLYVAPERVLTERTLALLDELPLALIAIDEAHCVSQWGHDFRPEYMQLAALAERFPGVPRLALTATADEPTQREIVSRLELADAKLFASSFDRPNIFYRVIPKASPREQLLRFIRAEHEGDAGIVYCLSRRKVEETAEWLERQGLSALPYHAGLNNQARAHNQERFLREEGIIMVATIAFGMGIDKSNVRFVAHLDLPKSLEAYYQETGRAGRDGLPASAWMAYGLQDVVTLRRMVDESEADTARKRVEYRKLEAMLGYCEITTCRRQSLLAYFGEALGQPCGHCDTCVEPVASWDGTQVAQKLLSCICRTGQRFGVAYVVDVLLGKDDERIRRNRHDRLSTFGIGTELDGKAWRGVVRQLVASGYISVDVDGYGSLRLTERCRAVLRGDETVTLRRDPARMPRAAKPRQRPSKDIAPHNEALWAALRECRRYFASEQGVAPYVIFHDTTLAQMAALRPDSHDALSRISGVGEKKLERYGDAFLALIREHEQGGG
ncbi:MAG: DNA helicase RecQ [Gammaproteobacteria bacterium]|nr:DNA helicase RecQ [Gammaproteobacteria bacterium]